ncbi:MAG TPA: AAA family ATPase [Streptosporangiaceae bacterium]|nr:AAA family ATPase [Streptosporangiaceae bacterium]
MSAGVVSPVFIGRRGEITSLAELLEQARTGEPAFALIGGEAGVGKTRLVGELAARAAAAGFLVLTGQCVELGAEGLPLAPLVDALRSLTRAMRPETLSEVLGPAGPRLARLLPELDPPAAVQPAGEDLQKAQLLELVLGMLDRLSAVRPVLLVIEDLHWGDQSTLDLTAFLVRSLRAARVLMVVTYRSDELHRRHPLRPLLTSWERMRTVRRIDVPRFDRDEVSAQLTAILGDDPAPGVADLIFDRSGGNAYLVEELAGTVQGDGDLAELPPSLRDVLLSRVDALSPDAQRLLRTASVAGRTVPDQLLAEVAGIGEADLFAALREAVENHLLQVDPGGHGYAFRHALTRDAVYEDMLPGERVRLHASYGAVLTREPRLAGDQAALPAALAYHWYAALDLPQALPAAIEAARHAMASYAPAEALRHLERALEIWSRVEDARERTGLDQAEVSGLAAEAAYRSGAVDRSQSLLADALAELPGDASPARRALLLERYAQAQRDTGRVDAAAASLQQALDLLPPDQPSRARATVLAALARAQMRRSDMAGTAELAGRALAAAHEAHASDIEADVAITLGSARAYLGPAEEGIEHLRAGLRLALEMDNPMTALRGYINLSDVLELLGRHAEAAQMAGDGLELAARAGMVRTLGSYLIGNQAEPLLRLGRWAEADQLTAQALSAEPEGVFAATLRQLRAELEAMRGHYDDADRELHRARHATGDTHDIQFTQPIRYAETMIALGRGDLAAARATVAAWLDGETELWAGRYAWPLLWLGMRTEADEATLARDRHEAVPERAGQRREELAELAARLVETARPYRGYQALVAAEQARAAGAGRPGPWRAAVAAWEHADEPYLQAYALLRLAEANSAAGDRPAAARAVRQAHELAERTGAGPLAAEAAALARRARLSLDPGAEPGSRPAAGSADHAPVPADELARFGLTDREREVLLLLAAGNSNPEIARTLFISAKTASVHVSNILAKLGVSGRVEAAAVAHRLGVTQSSA